MLDLEALACHRGSVLGPLPGQPQPSQKAFETTLGGAARLRPVAPVFAEGESRTIGRLRVPEALLEQLRAAPCVRLELPLPGGSHLLLEDYALSSPTRKLLRPPGGAARAARRGRRRGLAGAARAGALPRSCANCSTHYDPIYAIDGAQLRRQIGRPHTSRPGLEWDGSATDTGGRGARGRRRTLHSRAHAR